MSKNEFLTSGQLKEDRLKDRQEDFMRAQDFVIDYNQNMAYISDQRNKLSASSAFYLKMVARFAIQPYSSHTLSCL